MTARRLILLIVLYVTLDLANPMMPGAFNFNADESVEGIDPDRLHLQHGASRALIPISTAPLTDPKRSGRPPGWSRARSLSEWVTDLRQSHSPSSEAPPPPEDH